MAFGKQFANTKAMCKFFFILFFAFCQAGLAECIIDLETAWQRVLKYAPSLGIRDAEIDARIAEIKQVSVLANPIFSIEADNLGVSNHHDDEVDPPETTFAISQLVELGGKRIARAAFASSVAKIAFWDAQIQRQDLHLALTTTFINVSIAQERLRLAQAKQQLAEETYQTLCTLVEGGKVSPIQKKQALLSQMAAQIAVREAISILEELKKKLSAMWGSLLPDFDYVLFDFFNCQMPECFCFSSRTLHASPELAKAQAAIVAANENLKLQKINCKPDVTLTVGYTVFNDSPQQAWMIGAAMPLPFFDRNQGNIQKAYCEKMQAEFQKTEILRHLNEQIAAVQERLVTAFETYEMIHDEILSEATETFALIQTGYLNGKIDYLEVLNAQHTLFDIQEKYIESLYNYHLNKAELEHLTGQTLCMY